MARAGMTRPPSRAGVGYLIALIAISAVIILLFSNAFVVERSSPAAHPHQWFFSSAAHDPRSTFISGTSGRRFSMDRTRTYSGLRSLSSKPLVPDKEAKACETWAVITTVNPPTKTIQQLAALPDLCVCVVGDKKTPSDFQLPGVIYLSPDMQEALPYGVARLLPWNHFGRKNIGYLYAIHHGARAIYDTDDDNELLDGLTSLPYSKGPDAASIKRVNASADAEDAAVNLYPLFGASTSWPRGYPLDQVRKSVTKPVKIEEAAAAGGSSMEIGVIQSLANHDPDVDAIYRLSTLPLPFDFSATEPGLVALPPRSQVMPFNAQATLHFHNAFWGMLLPTTVHGRVSDIWRSYFTQRLLWETGDAVAFASPWVVQHRNAHNYLSDFQAEGHLYERATALVDYLFREWQCESEESDLAQCTVQLYKDMYEHGIVEAADVELVAQWVADLRAVGYTFPSRTKPAADASPRERTLILDDFRAEPVEGDRDVMITTESSLPPPAAKTQAWADFYEDADRSQRSDIPPQPVIIRKSGFQVSFQNVSLGSPRYVSVRYTDKRDKPVVVRLKEALVPVPVFKDILMIVNFNHAADCRYAQDFLSIYGRAFPNRVLVSTDPPLQPELVGPEPIHVVPEVREGWGMPRAVTWAMDKHPGYRGYLLVNNDVAFRFYAWGDFDQDRIWLFVRQGEYGPKPWEPDDPQWRQWQWSGEVDKGLLKGFLRSLSEEQQEQVLEQPNGEKRLPFCGSDLFYVPGVHKDQFKRYVDQLDGVWTGTTLFEAAVPIMLRAIGPYSQWQRINAKYCWFGPRDETCANQLINDRGVDYVHPWKFGVSGQRHPFLQMQERGQVVFLPV